MADMNHSKIPNLSIDSLDGSSGVSVPSLTVASTASLVVAGKAAFSGTESHSGTASFTGPVTFASTMSLGVNGFAFAGLRKSTVSVALAATAHESVTTATTINAVAAGDIVLAIRPASIWSGAYYDIGLEGVASANSTVDIVARNSAATTVNTAAMNFDIYWLDLA